MRRLYTLPLDVLYRVAADYGGSPISQEAAGAPILDFVPKPLAGYDIETNVAVTDEVTARFGLFEFPFGMSIDYIDMYCQAHVRNTYVWCAGYTEKGDERLWNVRSSSVLGVGTFSFALNDIDLAPGLYWIAYVGQTDVVPAPNINISTYDTHTTRTVNDNLAAGVFPVMGTYAIPAYTFPDTFDPPTDLTAAHDIFPQCRLRQIN